MIRVTHRHSCTLLYKWFHTFKDRKIECQGQVVGREGEYYIVQFYSWFDEKKSLYEAYSYFYNDQLGFL